MINILVLIPMICCIYYLYYADNNIYIQIGNSFDSYYTLPHTPITCSVRNVKYNCYFLKIKGLKYHASIYNGNKPFPSIPNASYNIIMTAEKLSQVKFMKEIGEGKSKYYQLAVDYRLFINKWHLPISRYLNIERFLNISQNNFKNINSFLKRKDKIVYIQRAHYKNRQFIVKEIMKNYDVDSYGIDMNNKEWPKDISKNNKLELLKKYKFCLAIENSIITWKKGTKYEAPSINNDYFTEKLTDCLKAGCIPLYFGPQNINCYLPHPNAIINLSNFQDINDLINYINKIKNNITMLEYHLIWHNNYSKEWLYNFTKLYYFSYCRICNHVKSLLGA